MTPASAFLPLIIPHAPGVSVVTAALAVRYAASEFCRATKCWRQRVSVTTVTNGFNILTLAGIDDAMVVEIEKASFNGRTIDPMPFEHLSLSDIDNDSGYPLYISEENGTKTMLVPFGAGTLDAYLVLAPTQGPTFAASGATSTQDEQNKVPDILFSEHAEAIAAGALARILAVPGREYSSPDSAIYFRNVFEAAMADAKVDAFKTKSRARIRTKSRFM